MLDTHQHFWKLSRGDYPWPNKDVDRIFRDFLPADLKRHLTTCGVAKSIAIQATDSVAETEFLLGLAAQEDFIAGVVGWVQLDQPDAIATIDRLRANPALKGLRPMLQNISDSNWILREDVQPALHHMESVGLRFDALITPRHIGPMITIADRYPDLKIVIDHMAKPLMGDKIAPSAEWLAGMTALSQGPNVFCKLSGVLTEAGPDWTPEQITPFAAHVLDVFGPSKTMWGSDWPVVNLVSDYETWHKTARKVTAHLSEDDQRSIFQNTGRRFYGLPTAG